MINELNNLKTQVCKLNAPTAVSEDTWNQFTANTTVALMAGGESSRFKSVPGSEHSNKSSFRLPNGDTMIEMAVRMYRDAGFKKFVCLVYHKAESVKEVLGNGSALGVEVLYSHDPEQAVGKGGAVLNAILNGSIDPTKPLIIHNPDDVILNSTKEFPRHISTGYLNGVEAGADITLVVVEETPYAYTGMVVTDNKITAIEQYPMIPIPTHIGVTIMSPSELQKIQKDFTLETKFNYETELFPALAAENKLYAVSIPTNDWLAVNTLKSYNTLLKEIGLQ